VTVVENAGDLGGKKGVNAPGVAINLPGLTDKDRDDITWGLQQGFNYISASFVRKPSDVKDIRDLVDAGPNPHVMIIPKIESQEGIDNADAILKVADGLMVARGDMGVEIPFEEVPKVQKSLIRKANLAHKPVITATQMLNSMQENPRPTRAEVADVANSVYDGTDATMLSGESANGKYPVEAVTAMAKIDEASDDDLPQHSVVMDVFNANDSITDTLGYSVVSAAERVGAKAIVAVTANGFTARSISRFRPNIPLIALTFTQEVADSLILTWGTKPIVIDDTENINEIYAIAEKVAMSENIVKKGDRMVITLGVPFGRSHHTNNMYVMEIGEE
jgi:pyruvate kinase